MKKTNYPNTVYKPYSVSMKEVDVTEPGKSMISQIGKEIVVSSEDLMDGFIAKHLSESMFNAVEHEINTPKILLCVENIVFRIERFFSKIRDSIYDIYYKHERFVKIRPAGSMMTIDAAMKLSAKLKSLKDFGDWVYDKWAKWDKGFNWYMIDTHVYIDKPDKRVGWRQTWMVTSPSGVENHIYPIAFTDKPFYKLKIKTKDITYIKQKYPKLLECVNDLKSGMSHESEIFRRYKEFAQEIDKAEPINIVAIDRNNSDTLITKIADDINKNA